MHEQRANFAIVLKAMRQERGLFQAQLAELAGVPQPMVSRLERGEQDLTVLIHALRLIQALEVPDELLGKVLGLGPQSAAPAATGLTTGPPRGEPTFPPSDQDFSLRDRDEAVAARY